MTQKPKTEEEQVAFFESVHERFRQAVERVGEVQRIAIARALLRRPRLLILDEPTNHLETAAIHRLLDQLARLEDRPGVLIISHDRDVLRHVERVHHLENGMLTLREDRTGPRAAILALGT